MQGVLKVLIELAGCKGNVFCIVSLTIQVSPSE